MVVTQVLTTRSSRALALLLLAWLPAMAAGWLIRTALAVEGRTGLGWIGLWLGCVVIAVGVATVLTRALPANVRADPAVRWAGFVAVGWAVAMAAGWFFGVTVGGPAFGLVIGLALASASGGARILPVALVAGCGLLGMLAGWLAVSDQNPVLVVVVTTTSALLAATATARVLAPGVSLWPLAGITGALAAAWVGSYELTHAVLSPISHGLAVGAEIVLAVAVGAGAVGWATRGTTGEPVRRVVRRWTVASIIGLAGAFAVALLLRLMDGSDGSAAGLFAHLDAGTTVGLGAAAGFAMLPTLRRLARASGAGPAAAA